MCVCLCVSVSAGNEESVFTYRIYGGNKADCGEINSLFDGVHGNCVSSFRGMDMVFFRGFCHSPLPHCVLFKFTIILSSVSAILGIPY